MRNMYTGVALLCLVMAYASLTRVHNSAPRQRLWPILIGILWLLGCGLGAFLAISHP